MSKAFPDPSLPVQEYMLSGFTYGERAAIRRARKDWLTENPQDKVGEHCRTCQICARPIFANKAGKIAHHGYRRPFDGCLIASCFGARCPPFEKSNKDLGRWINEVRSWRKVAIEQARAMRAGERDVPYTYRIWVRDLTARRRSRGNGEYVNCSAYAKTEWDFNWYQAMYHAIVHKYGVSVDKLQTFADAREAAALRSDKQAAEYLEEITAQSKRFNEWVAVE